MTATTTTDIEHGATSYSSGVKDAVVSQGVVASSGRASFFEKGSNRETKDLTWLNVSMILVSNCTGKYVSLGHVSAYGDGLRCIEH